VIAGAVAGFSMPKSLQHPDSMAEIIADQTNGVKVMRSGNHEGHC